MNNADGTARRVDAGTMPTIIHPPSLPDPTPNGYSTAVVAPPGCRLAFVSGQGGQDETGALAPQFEAQVERAYGNLFAVLESLGAGPEGIVKLTVFVVDHDMEKLGALTGAVARRFGAALPAQTLVPVPRLAVDGMLFEVEAVVALP